MKKLLILSLLGLSYGLNAMDSQPPRPSTSSQTTSAQEQQVEKTCPICLDKLGTEGGITEGRVEALPCGDVFCSACIRQAMQPSNAKCPCCRKTKAQLEQLSRGQRPTPTPTRRGRRGTPQISVPSADEILNTAEVFFANLSNSIPQSPAFQQSRNLARNVRQTVERLPQVDQLAAGIGQFFNALFNN